LEVEGSEVVDLTNATFVTDPVAARVPVTVKEVSDPEAMDGIVAQLTKPLLSVPPPEADSKEIPSGSESRTWTFDAVPGPALLTRSV
jgi:hypothetical protein